MITKTKQTLSKVLAPIILSTTVFAGFVGTLTVPQEAHAGGTAFECYSSTNGYGWNYQSDYSNNTLNIYKNTTTGTPILVDSYNENEFNSNHSGEEANSFALDKDGFGYVVKKDNNKANFLYQISPGGSPEFLGLLGGNDYNAATIFHNNNNKYYLVGKGMSGMSFVRFASDGTIAKNALVNVIDNTSGALLRKAKDFGYLPSTYNHTLPNGQRADIVGFDNENNRLILGSIAIFNQGTSSESMSVTLYSESINVSGTNDFGGVSVFNDKIFLNENNSNQNFMLTLSQSTSYFVVGYTIAQSANTDGASCNDVNFTSTNINLTAPTIAVTEAGCYQDGTSPLTWTVTNNNNFSIFIELTASINGGNVSLSSFNQEIAANSTLTINSTGAKAHNSVVDTIYKYATSLSGLSGAIEGITSYTVNCPTYTINIIQGLNDVTNPTLVDGSGCATAYATVTNSNAVTLYVEATYSYNGSNTSYLQTINIPANASYTFTSTQKLMNNNPFIWTIKYREASDSSATLNTSTLTQMTLDCPTTTTTTTGTNLPLALLSISGVSSALFLGRNKRKND